MINLPVKKLFRRCLLIVIIGMVTGCTSFKQMPSTLPPVEERSPVVNQVQASQPVNDVLAPTTEILKDPEDPLQIMDSEVNRLSEFISGKYKLSRAESDEIVSLAEKHAYSDFPTRNDILAIIAVESSFNSRAQLRGCYGLMQIEKKSHLKHLSGRNLYVKSVNIEMGARILNEYYNILKGDKRGTVLSYNAGIGNFLKRVFRSEYYKKYQQQLALLTSK